MGRQECQVGLVTAELALDQAPRAYTHEREPRPGVLKVAGGPEQQVLVGATAVGPEAGEWLQQLTLAIRAEVPVPILLDTIQPFPTFSEGVFFAVRELELA